MTVVVREGDELSTRDAESLVASERQAPRSLDVDDCHDLAEALYKPMQAVILVLIDQYDLEGAIGLKRKRPQ